MGRFLLTLGALAALAPFAASTASASCAVLPGQPPAGFATAPVVFVGTVVSTANRDREATVRVESVWRGPDLLTYVRVVGTPDPAAQATSVDRTFRAGQRYLFVPTNSTSPFQDNTCTATQLYNSSLAPQAPPDARPPKPGGDPGTASPATPLPWIGLGAILALAAVGLIVWRRRRASSF